MNDKFESRKKTCEKLGIHYFTLCELAEKNEIDTLKIGDRQLYNVDKYIKKNSSKTEKLEKKKICYCRVSSNKQKKKI